MVLGIYCVFGYADPYPDHPKYSVDEYLLGSTVLYAHLKPSLIYYWSCIVLLQICI